MWHRIQYDHWAGIVPVIAFVCTFSVFLLLTVRALLMRKNEVKRIANLPLEEPPEDRDRTSEISSP